MYVYNDLQDSEITLDMVVQIIKDRNLNNLEMMKNFLTYIPNPNHIKVLLTKAVTRVINSCPQTTRWLWQNANCLEPEVNVKSMIHQEISNQLLGLGISSEEFRLDSEGYLILPNSLKKKLLNRVEFVDFDDNLRLILSLLNDAHLETEDQ